MLATVAYVLVSRREASPDQRTVASGLAIGTLWVIEIAFNNLLHPPLPGRDTVDDCCWGSVAVLIVVVASVAAYQRSSFGYGLWTGT